MPHSNPGVVVDASLAIGINDRFDSIGIDPAPHGLTLRVQSFVLLSLPEKPDSISCYRPRQRSVGNFNLPRLTPSFSQTLPPRSSSFSN